jgi:hypothetical protein
MLRLFIITSLVLLTNLNKVYGQDCKKETLDKLQGTWVELGSDGKTLLIIKESTWMFNYKGFNNWGEPYAIRIENDLPRISDTVDICRFIELVKTRDSLQYKILTISDTTLLMTRFYIENLEMQSGGSAVENKYIRRITKHYKKANNLPQDYNFKATVFGEWDDEDTRLQLKSDSSFSITFSKKDYEYSTCGKFRFDGKVFVLKDLQDYNRIKYTIDCNNLTLTPIENQSAILDNRHLLFDSNNEIHLHYNTLGLWLRETHMILTKMSK